MGLAEAKKYIQDLHRRQNDPYLWPDFLTGLNDKAAILKKLGEIYPKLGKYAVAYVRISNIQPYLIKYGPDKHADIIQWAAAILKTTGDRCKSSFVGTLNTHDFIVICESEKIPHMIKLASDDFARRVAKYYSKEDIDKKATLIFKDDNGNTVRSGLIKFVSVITNKKLPIKRADLIQNMGWVCESIECTSDDVVVMTKDFICKC